MDERQEDRSASSLIDVPDLPRPEGAGSTGYGESFHLDTATGSVQLQLPLDLPEARELTPALTLRYNSGGSNGLFGIGFSLDLPSISRRTTLGVPRYDERDEFVTESGDVLVPRYRDEDGRWVLDQRTLSEGGRTYLVIGYRRRIEQAFDRIERWIDQADGSSFFRITGSNNVTLAYGRTPQARIDDPRDPSSTFRWMGEEQRDAKGNRIVYSYTRDADPAVASLYPDTIRYGNFRRNDGGEAFAFTVVFHYPEAPRPDVFETFRPGFALRTERLCTEISVAHCFPEALGDDPVTVSLLRMAYEVRGSASVMSSLVRTGRRRTKSGVVEERSLPPLQFGYSAWTPDQAAFAWLDVGSAHPPPSLAETSPLRFVDLYGDGLPGILQDRTASGVAPLYYRPLGNARFGAPLPLPVAPAIPLEAPGRTALLDLTAEGKRDCVVLSPGQAGLYENRNDGAWGPFRPLEAAPTDLDSPGGTFVDLSGGGRPDLLIAAPGEWRVHESLGRAGFGRGLPRPAPVGTERFTSDWEAELVAFADVFGDGLSHLAALSSGHLRVWPALGYGQFGSPRDIPGLPIFDATVTSRDLLFADLTGVGGADLLVMKGDRVAVYLNHYGQRFTFLREVTLPAEYGALDLAQAIDLLGIGTSQLVVGFARRRPGAAYLDLCSGHRPFLMTAIFDGMGSTTTITYKSSVEYALADRAAGAPWLTSLPFPVSVAAQVEQYDAISRTRLVRVAEYKNGYFDPVDRQFAGFGYVQVQDALTVDAETWRFPVLSREAHLARAARDPVSPSVEPLFSRSWLQVGAFAQAAALRAQMLDQAYRGPGETLLLPGPAFAPAFELADGPTLRLAYKALLTRPLRGENYGVDPEGTVEPVPYSVSQSSYGVELIQPSIDGHSAVVMVTALETATLQYEKQADDPFVSHQLTVGLDRFGQPIRTVMVGYARSAASGRTRLPGQREAMVRLATRGVINHVDGAYRNASGGTTPVHDEATGGAMHVVGLGFEDQSFELSGFAQPTPFYTRSEAREIARAALGDVVPYGVPFTSDKVQARLFRWERSYYWDADRTRAVLQRTGPQILSHHGQDAVLSDAFAAEVLAGRVDAAYLRERGGYLHEDGYFWGSGQTVSYADGALFYIPTAYTDPFGAWIQVVHDDYQLMLVRKIDAMGFSVRAEYDYQALKPGRTVDENDVTEEFLYDALGELMVRTRFGTEGGVVVGDDPIGDYVPVPARSAEEVLANPSTYLQGASAYYFYALDAWQGDPPMPVFTLELKRRSFVHAADGAPSNPDDIEVRLQYFDAQQRKLAVAALVRGTPPYSLHGETAPRFTAEIVPAAGGAPAVWLVTEQQRFDDRGNAVVRYQPYFAEAPAYVEQPPAGRWRIAYDALYREVRTETPKGFLTATQRHAWSQVSWDEDDTVTRSPYYEQHIHDPDLPPAERAALEMAARLADTPSTTDRDVLGRDIRLTTLLVASEEILDPPPPRALHTVSSYDALDRVTAYADPRFYDPEDPARPRFFNAFIRYDMRGRPAWQKSADAGNLPLRSPADGLPWIRLFDALDGALDEWDRRGFRTTVEYDVLRLPTGVRLRGDGLSVLAERIVYGDDPRTNTVHRIIEQDDQAGVERTLLYSILGDPISRSRQFRAAAEGVADWEDPTQPVLQPVVWAWITRGNALGEPVYYQAPNGATVSAAYTNNGWQRLVTLGGQGAELSAAEVTRFSPAGLPAALALGNGLLVDRSYEPATLRLSAIRAVDRDEVLRQDIAYTYDPVGNVTNLENRVPIGGGAAPEDGVYRYDSLYRLISATGRRQASKGGALEPYARSYRLDDSGNLAEIVDAAGPAWSRKYAISPSANHAITEAMANTAPPDTFYDADGLLTALPDGTALFYNPGGQLARAESAGRGKSLFQYTGGGVRARKRTEAGETYYLEPFLSEGTPDDPAEIALSVGDEVIAVARYAGGGPAASAPELTYQLADRLHSVVERTDAGGRTVDQQAFYPYGATAIYLPANGGEAVEKRYQFTGQERDPSTGLYAFAKRYYATELARWIAPDPAGTIDGINLFAYVNGNPLTLRDPTGENGKDGNGTPTTTTEKVKQVSKTFNKYGVYSNIIGEVLAGAIHAPPLLNLDKYKPFLTAYQIKAGNIAGFGGVFGGLFGGIYSAIDIKKNGFNFYNTTTLAGQIAFAFEGYKIYKSLFLSDKHAFHTAHVRIGYIGFAADALKIPYYLKSKDYGQALFYGGLGLGNLRSALPDKAVLDGLTRLFNPISTAYAGTSVAARFPSSTQVVSSVPKLLASVKGYQILAFTFLAKMYATYSQRSKDKI